MIYRITFLIFILCLVFFLRFSSPHNEAQKNNITKPQDISEKKITKEIEESEDKSQKSKDPYVLVNKAITRSLSFFDENNYNRTEEDYWNKLNKARDVLEDIVNREEFKSDAKSKYFLGKVYVLLNEKKKAKKLFEMASELQSDQSFAWNRDHALYSEDYLIKLEMEE